ncbi:helix-turn-helix domain-containing protein [Burkholderia plantarii]|uniref:helix-turn-helix domain-containing protein n=1 Tax=Burkholderia plantarii TaxID=41899 RepID=UPI000B27D5DC|nr:helix-turn-helix domain-containing protein [Burkholderia plantarii]
MKPWTWRHAIINSNLPATTRHVLLTLSCHVNDAGEPVYPSTLLLAAETGLSERAVITHLRAAAEAGWLVTEKHGYGGQKWARNQYYPLIPDDFQLPDRDSKGTELRSVPQKSGKETKALNEVQQLVDKGTERGSAPSEKALNVVPEGTEPNDRKALNDVQSNTAVNPAVNSSNARAAEPAAAAAQKTGTPQPSAEAELAELLIELERIRGRTLTINRNTDRAVVLAWVGKGVTVDQLRAAHAAAVAARDRDTDARPTYLAFVDSFLGGSPAQGGASAPDGRWFESPPGVDAKGFELGVRIRRADEDWRYYRVLVARAAREPAAIEAVLKDAQRFNATDLYKFARSTFGDELLPVDDFPS